MTRHHRHFARQPIVNRRGAVIAYELLYRSELDALAADVVDGPAATRSVLAASRGDGSPRCREFVNLPREMLLDRTMLGFPPRWFGAEVLEDVVAEPAVIAALDELRGAGYTVALDDFRPDPRRTELLDHADIVKLDVQALAGDELALACGLAIARGLVLLAEKVETLAEFEALEGLGFELFQGYLFGAPEIVSPRGPDPGWMRSRERLALPLFRPFGGWVGQRGVAGPVRP